MEGDAPKPPAAPRSYFQRAIEAVMRTVGQTKEPNADEFDEAFREAHALNPDGHPLDAFRKTAARNIRYMMIALETIDTAKLSHAPAAGPPAPPAPALPSPDPPYESG